MTNLAAFPRKSRGYRGGNISEIGSILSQIVKLWYAHGAFAAPTHSLVSTHITGMQFIILSSL
jgi:hypothetical protein